MDKNYDIVYSKAIAAVENNKYTGRNTSDVGGLLEARQGLIFDFKKFEASLDNFFGNTYGPQTRNELDYQEYKESLRQLNYLSRRVQYYDYATASVEQIEKFRTAEINYLQDAAIRAERLSQELQIDLSLPVSGNTQFDVTKNQAGVGLYKLRQPSGVEPVVSNLDSYSTERNEIRKTILAKSATFNYQLLKSKIAMLSSLTTEQYKVYRINQIALSQEEILAMNADIQREPDLLASVEKEQSAGKTM